MKADTYLFDKVDVDVYQFHSTGFRGKIRMVVVMTPIVEEIINLGFGVWDEVFKEIDDSVETRNGDGDRILATVAKIALDYLDSKPTASVYATGSCPKRTRKYQMGIGKYLSDLNEKYVVKGFLTDKKMDVMPVHNFLDRPGAWQIFQAGVNYDAFLLSLK